MKLTQNLYEKIVSHLEDRRFDMNPEEIDEAIKILEFNIDSELTRLNLSFIDRLMDDNELQEELEKCKLNISKNAFD